MTDLNTETVTEPNLAEMSDEDFENFDPTSLLGAEAEAGSNDLETQSAAEIEAGENNVEETGGAAPAEASPDDNQGGADPTSTEVTAESVNEEQPEGEHQQTTEANQAEAGTEGEPEGTETETETVDYEKEYNRVMAPFRASKREIKPKTPEDLRRLAQMGADYSRKMEAMKPYQKVVKTLEKNGLLDIEKINFLIDLDKKNPEAVKKFLKDNDIDPMRVDLEGDIDYKPTDHMVGDQEIELDAVLDEIRDTPTFARTVKTITDDWDKASRDILMGNPTVIRDINGHIADGYFDKIADVVASERAFGRLEGLSDLEAYKMVGDAIQKAGGFNEPNQSGTSNTSGNSQDSAQTSGSDDAVKAAKRAASPTKGSASAGKPKIDLGSLTDEEFEKINPADL